MPRATMTLSCAMRRRPAYLIRPVAVRSRRHVPVGRRLAAIPREGEQLVKQGRHQLIDRLRVRQGALRGYTRGQKSGHIQRSDEGERTGIHQRSISQVTYRGQDTNQKYQMAHNTELHWNAVQQTDGIRLSI